MKSSINVDMRNEIGSAACHRVRIKGNVPAIIYGHDVEARTITVDAKEMESILRSYGNNILIDLYLNGIKINVMIKDIQRDPVTNNIIHLDFQEISNNKFIHTYVPIKLIGKDIAESNEGVVQQQLRKLHVECFPNKIPENIEIDISKLKHGHPFKVCDMEIGEELSILNESSEVIAALAKIEKIEEIIEEDIESENNKEI